MAPIAFAEHSKLADEVAIPGAGIHIINQLYALEECGRLAEASGLAAMVYEAMDISTGADGFMWVAHQLGRCALLSGKPVTARRWLLEALARTDELNKYGPSRLVLSALAVAHAYLGEGEAAAAAV